MVSLVALELCGGGPWDNRLAMRNQESDEVGEIRNVSYLMVLRGPFTHKKADYAKLVHLSVISVTLRI